jgi:hypothetical protein
MRVPWAVVYQPDELVESTGAVLAARGWFGLANLVLLPDQMLLRPRGAEVAAALTNIDRGAVFCFLAARETDLTRLAVDGALLVESGVAPDQSLRLVGYADKPGLARADEFNAVWFGYAFAGRQADETLRVLHSATVDGCLPSDGLGSLLGSPVIEVGPFVDLGTWSAVRKHLAEPVGRVSV